MDTLILANYTQARSCNSSKANNRMISSMVNGDNACGSRSEVEIRDKMSGFETFGGLSPKVFPLVEMQNR